MLFSTIIVSTNGSVPVFADKSKPYIFKDVMKNYESHFQYKSKHHKSILPKDSLTLGLSTPYVFNINEKTNKIYVANYGGSYDVLDGSMSIIDGNTNRILDVMAVGDFPNSAGINEKTNKIYVTNHENGTVTVIDGKTDSIIDRIHVGSGPLVPPGCLEENSQTGGLCESGAGPMVAAVNEKTNRIYVALWVDNAVSVIDGNTNQVIAVIPTGVNPFYLDVNEKTNKIYVANTGGSISIIDGNTNTVITNIPVSEGFPFGVAVNEKTNMAYVSNSGNDQIYVIDGKTDSIINTIQISGFPIGVTVNEKTNTIYVAKTFEDSIVAINGKTNEIIDSPIQTGSGPYGIAVNEKTNRIYVLNLFDGTITVLGNKNLKIAGIDPNPPIPLRVPIKNIGILQLAIHDLYNVDRTQEVNLEDEKLNLSTIFDHGDENIANGGEFRNMENPITFTVAKNFGQAYLKLINQGKTPEEARSLIIEQYVDAVKNAYETTFYEQFPLPEPFDALDKTLVGDLALRSLHDLIPGKIKVNGVLISILDPSLVGQTLSEKDMKQLSSPLDGQYDAEFRDMINPMNGEHVDLLERDSSFATQFGIAFTFEEFLAELEDGKYDPYDQVMRNIRAEFAFAQ